MTAPTHEDLPSYEEAREELIEVVRSLEQGGITRCLPGHSKHARTLASFEGSRELAFDSRRCSGTDRDEH